MTTTYTIPIEISMDIDYLANAMHETVIDYIANNCEIRVEEIPKEIRLQILKDAAKYILANF